METIVKKIVNYLDADERIWNEKERMEMMLGLEILVHNIVMIVTILLMAKVIGIFVEAMLLLTAYGILKMTAGGIHFNKSSSCLLATGAFVMGGAVISHNFSMDILISVWIYIVCIFFLAFIGPQGTPNNPISREKYKKLKIQAICIVLGYLIITVCMPIKLNYIKNLLLIAVVFETISLLPLGLKSRNRC